MDRIALKRIVIRLGLAAVGLALLSACGGTFLRDDYMGKSVLQPESVQQPVKRDAYGNPILE